VLHGDVTSLVTTLNHSHTYDVMDLKFPYIYFQGFNILEGVLITWIFKELIKYASSRPPFTFPMPLVTLQSIGNS
jgi:hypothetical protein